MSSQQPGVIAGETITEATASQNQPHPWVQSPISSWPWDWLNSLFVPTPLRIKRIQESTMTTSCMRMMDSSWRLGTMGVGGVNKVSPPLLTAVIKCALLKELKRCNRRALAILSQDLVSIPSTHVTAHNDL